MRVTSKQYDRSSAAALAGGFTLLEVILALMLTAFVLAAISTAIDFHLRVLEKGRERIEEAIVARALLNRIGDDLRNAVPYSTAENTGTDTGETEEETSSDNFTAGDEEGLQSVPGIYGGSDWILIDVSRVPRADQYYYESTPMMDTHADSEALDVVSDLKTVAYSVVGAGEVLAVYTPDGEKELGGLVRRELDQAVTLWASEQGYLADWDMDLVPVAPEVAAIKFFYFDGSEWLEEWDSEEQGALPLAVDVYLAFHPRDVEEDDRAEVEYDEISEDTTYPKYQLTVHLPATAPTGGRTALPEKEEVPDLTLGL